MKKAIINFFTGKRFKTFVWQTVNAFIAIIIMSLQEDPSQYNYVYFPLLLSALNMATKYINKTYL